MEVRGLIQRFSAFLGGRSSITQWESWPRSEIMQPILEVFLVFVLLLFVLLCGVDREMVLAEADLRDGKVRGQRSVIYLIFPL